MHSHTNAGRQAQTHSQNTFTHIFFMCYFFERFADKKIERKNINKTLKNEIVRRR